MKKRFFQVIRPFNIMICICLLGVGFSGCTQAPTEEIQPEGPKARFVTKCEDFVCLFNATISTPGDTPISYWFWGLGEGNTTSGMIVEQKYPASGNYTVTLVVMDEKRFTDSTFFPLSINETGASSLTVPSHRGR